MKNNYTILFLLLLTTFSYSQNPCPGTPTVTYAGKIYNTVQIGSQCWLKENLDVGTMIDSMTNPSDNGIIEKYCYNDSLVNCTIYGGLYLWNEAMQYVTTPGTKGICPTGWHMPDTSEFITLETTVNLDGNVLKAVGQGTGNGAGTDTSGFSDLLAGYRNFNGPFFNLGNNTYFRTSTEETMHGYAYLMSLHVNSSNIYFDAYYKVDGLSVRCLKDASTGINDHSNNTLPNSIDLFQNYPNPFNPSTTISFTLPEKSRVVLSVYNELGEKVAVLFNGEQEAGMHNIEWNASKFVSGVYFYELKTGKFSSVKKLSLMK